MSTQPSLQHKKIPTSLRTHSLTCSHHRIRRTPTRTKQPDQKPSHRLENIRLIRRELETRKKNTERPPLIVIPVHVFQTAFSLINWGKWLRTSAPGPVPYIPFSFALMSSASRFASCLLPHYAIKSRFCFPLFIFPIPLPPLLFPPLHPPLLPLHAPCPQNREALMIMYFSSQLDHAIILLEQIFSSPQYCTCL